jgi:hypothetical protein
MKAHMSSDPEIPVALLKVLMSKDRIGVFAL